MDLSEIKNIEYFFKKIEDKTVDTLINNAGLALGKTSFEEYDWEPILDIK